MKLPTNKAELLALLNTTEKALQDLVERKAIRLIPGVSATLPSPTVPIEKKNPPTAEEK
jgi:hypothetical protein